MASPRKTQSNSNTGVPVSPRLRESLQAKRSNMKTKILGGASLVAGFFSVPGVALGVALDGQKNRIIEKNQLEVLAKHFAPQIGIVLGMDPSRVGVEDLKKATEIDPNLAMLVKKVQKEKQSSNRASLLAAGAVAGVGFIPGVSGITNIVAKGAIDVGAGVAGTAVSGAIDKHKEKLEVHDEVVRIDAKLKDGIPVTEADIVMLRLAQNLEWQKEFKKRYHKAFHQMSESERAQVVQAMPEMLLGAQNQVVALNKGLISVQNLVMEGPNSDSNFTGNITSKQTPSFREAEDARRALAQQASDVSRSN